jgi:hypothetical protein
MITTEEVIRALVDTETAAWNARDADALVRNRTTKQSFHWKGRACKVYTKVGERWLFLFQTGLLEY